MIPRYLYLHVPFCLRRCPYCDFAVQATRRPPVEAWLDAVDAELTAAASAYGWTQPLPLRTIYVGGGTPSLLGSEGMAQLRARLERHATWGRDLEWTAEANPETFTPDVAGGWHAAGVNRLSLGVQTFHEPALRWMGRLHGAEGARAAVAAARVAGFENVSLDLIFALPGRLGRDWSADLAEALALKPEHISLYGLSAEPGTPLGRWVASGRETMAGEEIYAAEYLLAVERAAAAGLAQYEVSNFARPGHESMHNAAYWQGAAYLGIGPGAHSFLPPVRSWNVRGWDQYRELVNAGSLPLADRETVGAEAGRLERIWLGLRTSSGLELAQLSPAQRSMCDAWRADGLAEAVAGRVRLTPRGFLLLDRLAVQLDEAP